MGKKICYTLCLAVCLLLAVSVSAFAAEVPVVALPEIAPAVLHTESEPAFSLFSGEAQPEPLAWGEDSTCYRDQLKIYCDTVLEGDRTALNIYCQLEELLLADRNNTARLPLAEDLEFVDEFGNPLLLDCWVTPALVQQSWDMESYFDAYVAEQLEKDPNYNYDTDPDRLKWAEAFFADQDAWFQQMNNNCWLACQAFVMDYPEYFWIRANGGCQFEAVEDFKENGWQIYNSQVSYAFTAQAGCETLETRVALQEELEKVAADLQAQTSGMTPVQKITYWDNWLAEQNAYNYGALSTGLETSSYPWSIVSGLLPEHDPVCEGYAKTLQLLCQEADIPCVQISGKANGDHMWLAIRMEDGNWYYCDPTWNDPTINIVDEYGNLIRTEEHNYSSRQHLLTAQPSDHVTSYDPRLGTPTLSNVSYFEETETTVEETMNTWEVTEDGLTGMEAGSGAMMVILYDENGKMLDLGFCAQGAQCGEDSWFYLAPVFDAEDLAQATRIVRINVGDKTAWSPLTALKAIKEAPEVEPPEAE